MTISFDKIGIVPNFLNYMIKKSKIQYFLKNLKDLAHLFTTYITEGNK